MRSLEKILYSLFFLFLVYTQVHAQSMEVADEYFHQKEYKKAIDIYEKLSGNPARLRMVHANYLASLLALKDYEQATKLLKRQIKNSPNDPKYYIELGIVWEYMDKQREAEKQFNEVIEKFKKEPAEVEWAAEAFIRNEKFIWAEKLLLAARKYQDNPSAYVSKLAEVYLYQNKKEEMFSEYLQLAVSNEGSIEYVQSILQDALKQEEDLKKMEQLLLTLLQKRPNEKAYNELLFWLYMQQKNFNKAFVQAKSMDKRFKLNGSGLMELATVAFENKDYTVSTKVFQYIIEQYPSGNYTLTARRYLIRAKEEIVKNTYPIDREKVRSLIVDYKQVLEELGTNMSTLEIMKDMAYLQAFYLDEKQQAKETLNSALTLAKGFEKFTAEAKIVLGDIYLLEGDFGEASLLYLQAEKLVKDSPIAYEAKLKNSKLYYYKGEFEFAQSQLDVLKLATSREIANDAMDLSILIQDNIGLDSTERAMRKYSQADLYLFQNKISEATLILDSLLIQFAGHSITDEVYWLKADIYLKLGSPEKAIEMLEKIEKEYKYDILSDDAHFLMAKVYEEKLNNSSKAMDLYKDHLVKYPGSIYVAEARRRFRTLRGDDNLSK